MVDCDRFVCKRRFWLRIKKHVPGILAAPDVTSHRRRRKVMSICMSICAYMKTAVDDSGTPAR
jgi:hypothetical protein